MFGNTNKKVGEIDKTVNKNIEDEKNVPVNGPDLNIGNQENLINAGLLNISNEFNNQIIEGDKPENGTDESADEAENLFAESRKYLIERGYLDEDKGPDVMNNGFSGQLPGLGQTKKKDLLDDIDIENSLAYYRNNDLNRLDKAGRDKQNEIQKCIKKKPKKSAENIVNEGIPEKEEDLTQVDESLEPVNGLDFKMRKHPERIKPGKAKKLLSWLAYYGGKFAGKLIGGFLTVLNAVTGGKVTGSNTFRGWINRFKSKEDFQQDRDRSLIPGWDGAKFEDEQKNDEEVQADFRRVPEVWSYPIAVSGTETKGKGENAKEKQRPPIISVYVEQGSKRYTQGADGGTGHAGIGIEYSRRNRRTGSWERFNLHFGYGPQGGFNDKALSTVLSYNNATIPGALRNERGNTYTISRSYPATPKQVNRVLRAAETYADKGYNQYTRNCTTFVKDMVVNVAKIKGAEGIFQQDYVYVPASSDKLMLGAGAMAPYFKAEMENNFEKIGHKNDLNYQNFGGKMATKKEYDQYKNSIKFFSFRSSKTDSPNGLAENMFRAEGGKSGKIGNFKAITQNRRSVTKAPIGFVRKRMPELAEDLRSVMEQVTPDQKFTDGTIPGLGNIANSLSKDNLKKLMEDIPFDAEELKQTKPDDLIRYRSIFTDVINNVNTLLFKYYHNDKRIQKEALYIINMANYGINAIDDAYESAGTREEDSDLGSLTGDFIGSEYAFNYTDTKGGNRTIDMTPTRYEAWIQVCKTPEEALRNYGRLMELGMKDQNGQKLDAPEQKEYDTLKRLYGLALQFENSHKYMLSKGKFSQQDVDYAFALEQKERDRNIQSNMIEKSQFQTDRTLKNMINPSASASGTYQMLMMKTIFGGMKEKFTKKFPDIKYVNFDQKEMLNWVAEDSVTYIPRKKDETKTILRGIKHTIKDPNADKLKNRFSELLAKWLFQLYHQDLYEFGQTEAYLGILKTMTDDKGPLMRQIDALAEEVMGEENS